MYFAVIAYDFMMGCLATSRARENKSVISDPTLRKYIFIALMMQNNNSCLEGRRAIHRDARCQHHH